MKLSELLQRLEDVCREHGDLDVYIGFPNFPGEGHVEGELDEVEFGSYDPNDASDKGLMLWAHPSTLSEWDQPSVAHLSTAPDGGTRGVALGGELRELRWRR